MTLIMLRPYKDLQNKVRDIVVMGRKERDCERDGDEGSVREAIAHVYPTLGTVP